MEPDLSHMTPADVSLHFTRVPVKEDSEEELGRMAKHAEEAARLLSDAHPDVIAFGCTGASFLKGIEFDNSIMKKIEKASGAKAVTTSTAVVEALLALNLRNLTVFTPYEQWLNTRLNSFLADNGFRVVKIRGLGMKDPGVQASLTPRELVQWVMEMTPSGDGVLISCTNIRASEAIQELESRIGKPVITSNQATLWKMLSLTDSFKSIQGYGMLLSNV